MGIIAIIIATAGIYFGVKATFARELALAAAGIIVSALAIAFVMAPIGFAMAVFVAATIIAGGFWFYFKGIDIELF